MTHTHLFKCISLAILTSGIAACSSGGGGASSSEITSIGTITGFGSVYVNGVEFETNSSTYRVDDDDAFDDTALAIGMKVKLKGTINANGTSGTAKSIQYDDDVEGPVDTGSLVMLDATTKSFTIFGLLIRADANVTAFDDGASFDGLAESQILEISGYFDGNQIVASRIEKQNDLDNIFEVKGTVSSYSGSSITLTLQTGESVGPLNISPSAILEIPANPVGLFVEVKLEDQSGNLVAIKIERDDEDLLNDDDDDISIRGFLSDDGNGGFLLNGIQLVFDNNVEYKPASLEGRLVTGLEVKVEGDMQGDSLLVDEVEIEEGDIEIEAGVIDVSFTDNKNGTVTLNMGNSQSLLVHLDNTTLFKDNTDNDLNDDDSFNLNELSNTDFVEIEAYLDDQGQLKATSIERDSPEDTKLESKIDSFENGVSVTLQGITYTVDGSTSYEINDIPGFSATDFFSALGENDVVEVKDIQPDGTAEELELDD